MLKSLVFILLLCPKSARNFQLNIHHHDFIFICSILMGKNEHPCGVECSIFQLLGEDLCPKSVACGWFAAEKDFLMSGDSKMTKY